MPLDSMGHTSYDDFYRNRYLGAQLKFAWFPQRCNLTGKRIWLEKAYRLTAVWRDDIHFVAEHRWHDKNTHIMWLLKR